MTRFRTFSMSRYNGGIATKRRWGSSTVTVFDVEDTATGRTYRGIKAYGATPGERHTYAVARVGELIDREVKPAQQ